jgi:hypothetical protein
MVLTLNNGYKKKNNNKYLIHRRQSISQELIKLI